MNSRQIYMTAEIIRAKSPTPAPWMTITHYQRALTIHTLADALAETARIVEQEES